MAKPKLSDEVKTYIVQALACFDSPSVVAAAVKKDFGLDVSRQLVESHDPNKKAASGLRPSGALCSRRPARRSLRTRGHHRHQPPRSSAVALQRMADKMEQAAKEVGDSYTNRRAITGPDGGPVEVRNGLS